jgi:hypothetical protein
MIERRSNARARQYFDVACVHIRDRMKPVCADMPEPDFERLIVDMARVRLRHEPWLESESTGPSRSRRVNVRDWERFDA